MHHGLFLNRCAQRRITGAHCVFALLHAILRDRSLGQPYAGQVFDDGGRLPHGNSVHVMQNMRQRLDPWPYPMRGRPLLAGGDFRMLPAHFPAASPALANLHREKPHFRLRLRRNVRG
jgi:hypothetical protein